MNRLWLVRLHQTANVVAIVHGRDREFAKENARDWLGGDPDQYVVTPLTNEGDRIAVSFPLGGWTA